MQPAPPIDVIDLFAEMREQLLDLLASLSDDEWAAPTICAPWAVKDLTAHIIGDDLGVVSRGRDGYNVGFIDVDSYGALVAAINRQNEQWVCAMRHLSPGAIIEMLRFSDERAFAHFRSLDFDAIGGPVDWAGPEPAPVWLDVAREYTERWSHQQQIRDAVDKPGLKDRRFFAPLLDAYVRGVPHAFRDTAAPEGTHVRIEITGAERAAHGRSCAPTPAGRCTPASTRRRPRRQRSIKRRMAPVHERHDAGRRALARTRRYRAMRRLPRRCCALCRCWGSQRRRVNPLLALSMPTIRHDPRTTSQATAPLLGLRDVEPAPVLGK